MNKFEALIEKEVKRHEEALTKILNDLEKEVVALLKQRGNFMMMPNDSDTQVYIIDGAKRKVVYRVAAVGLTTSDDVIYVTNEALYEEHRNSENPEANCNEDGSYTEKFVKSSKYWWFINDDEYSVMQNIQNRNAILNDVYNILNSDKK